MRKKETDYIVQKGIDGKDYVVLYRGAGQEAAEKFFEQKIISNQWTKTQSQMSGQELYNDFVTTSGSEGENAQRGRWKTYCFYGIFNATVCGKDVWRG